MGIITQEQGDKQQGYILARSGTKDCPHSVGTGTESAILMPESKVYEPDYRLGGGGVSGIV
jgi:hypothetical protein